MPTHPQNPHQIQILSHRCRFVHFLNSKIVEISINSLGGVAVGKENGNIFLFSSAKTNGTFVHISTLYSAPFQGLQSLDWIDSEGTRLVSAGLSGLLLEWNVTNGKLISTTSSFGGAVWCLKASPSRHILAVGCEDGAVRLFRILEGSGIEYLSAIERQPCKVLSLAWHPTKPIILTGGTQGRARVLHVDTGRAIHHLTLDAAFVKESDDSTIVWQVLILADGTLVTGDSLGNVCFWQGRTATLLKKFPLAHEADVLCMTASKDGKRVYSSGVDRKMVEYKFMPLLRNGGGEWMISGEKRYHTHDVNALALLQDERRPHEEMLVSGGVDTNIIFSGPTSHFTSMKQHRLEMTPQYSPITISRSKRLVMCMFDDCLKIWALTPSIQSGDFYTGQRLQPSLPHKHLLTLNIPNGDSNLVTSAFSRCGEWVVCSTISSLKLFRLTYTDQGTLTGVTQVKSEFIDGLPGALYALFTADSGRLVVAGVDGIVRVLAVDESVEEVGRLDIFKDRPVGLIRGIYISPSNKYLVLTIQSPTAAHTSTLESWDIDTMQKWATLPSFSCTVVAACFGEGDVLGIATVTNHVYFIDVAKNELTEWSRRNSMRMPASFTAHNNDTIRGLFFVTSGRVCVWGSAFTFTLDLTHDLKLAATRKSKTLHDVVDVEQGQSVQSLREGGEDVVKLDHRFTGIMYFDCINAGEVVVVERPALQVLAELPPAWRGRHKYGS